MARLASAAARTRRRLSWEKWAGEVDEFLARVDRLVWPDLIIIGGGVSKEAGRFIPRLTVRPPVVAAELRNEAGIVGAALVAAGAGSSSRAPQLAVAVVRSEPRSDAGAAG